MFQYSKKTRTRLHRARPSLEAESLERRELLTILPVGPGRDFERIQDAINVGQPGDVIDIAPAVYPESLNIVGKQGLTLRGQDRAQTVIKGGSGPGVTLRNVDRSVVVANVTITGSRRGVVIDNASPIIMASNIEGNCHHTHAGGILVQGFSSQPIIVGNIIRRNRAGTDNCGPAPFGGEGGGVEYIDAGGGILADNEIRDNWAWLQAGGVLIASSSPLIFNNRITGNVADFHGGIVVVGSGAAPEIRGNLIDRNVADWKTGSGIAVLSGASPRVQNNTIDRNTGGFQQRYGIFVHPDGTGLFVNNIVTSNGDVGIKTSVQTALRYNLFSGQSEAILGPAGSSVGSVFADPSFVGPDDYHLNPGSPAIDAGEPDVVYNDLDGTPNDLGRYGGPNSFNLPKSSQDQLLEYARATLRYFVNPESNNTLIGWTHAFFGNGSWRQFDQAAGRWVEQPEPLPRGYGSHVNINEVTLGFSSLALSYKMGLLTYAQSWGQILKGLTTLQALQNSGDDLQYSDGNFHRAYLTTVFKNGRPDQDRTLSEIQRDANNVQSSDDNALGWINLDTLKGLASDPEVSIQDRSPLVSLISQIQAGINLRRFVVNDSIVHEYRNGLPSQLVWDREAAEGPIILSALRSSNQITHDEFYRIAPSLQNHPVNWNTRLGGTIPIEVPSFHAAQFMHGLRSVHGWPSTSQESAGLNFFEQSLAPVTEAQVEFALAEGFNALGSQAMTQTFEGIPLFALPDGRQVRFPGNEGNVMPVPQSTLAGATAAHSLFIPLQRWRYLKPQTSAMLLTWMPMYRDFFHAASSSDLGWEVVLPWHPADASRSWVDSNNVRAYSDWGRAFEALNSAYLVISIHDGLHPDRPLASYSPNKELITDIARYFDTGEPVPPPRPSVPDLFEGDDTGLSVIDNVTNIRQPQFSGTGLASASRIELIEGGTVIGTGMVDSSTGAWTVRPEISLSDGIHLISARLADREGRLSRPSDSIVVTIDTSPPPPPSVPDLVASSDTGISDSDDVTKTTTPSLTGSAETGALVELFDEATTLGGVLANLSGLWSFTSGALTDGTHSITATAADVAGNVSTASAALSVTIDTTIAMPSAPDLDASSDTGSSSTDNLTKHKTPTLIGTAELGSTVSLVSGLVGLLGKSTANGLGTWRISSPELPDGVHAMTVTATDVAGNTSPVSPSLAVTVDTRAPIVEVGVQYNATRKLVKCVVLTASEELDPAEVNKPSHYRVLAPGKDNAFGTSDDVPVPLDAPLYGYDGNRWTVSLPVRSGFSLKRFYQLTVDDMLADLAGNRLDGDDDGTPGGRMVISLGVGTALSYRDRNGDQVSLNLSKGGVMQMVRSADGEAKHLHLIGVVNGKSILSGKVKKTANGDGKTTIPVLSGTAGVKNKLATNPDFVIGNISAEVVDPFDLCDPHAARQFVIGNISAEVVDRLFALISNRSIG